MKTLALITAGLFVLGGAFAAPGDQLVRISDATGVPAETLQAQRAATGFGYGELETANLLANASGQSFDTIAARHQAGEGWGKIAHGYGLRLGDIVSAAHRSDQGALHARSHGNSKSDFVREHGRSSRDVGRGHSMDKTRDDLEKPNHGQKGRGKGKSGK